MEPSIEQIARDLVASFAAWCAVTDEAADEGASFENLYADVEALKRWLIREQERSVEEPGEVVGRVARAAYGDDKHDKEDAMDDPIMVGDLVKTLDAYLEEAPLDVLEAWSRLLPILAGIIELCDGRREGDPMSVCAWCKQPAANMKEVRAHILTCKMRPQVGVEGNRDG